MISSLRGRALHIASDAVIVDVGGVGFSVAVTPTLSRTFHLGDEIVLHTHLVVREDALSLFGFGSRDELDTFIHLLGVSGVGPKSALGVLASLTVDHISAAVSAEDDAPFRRVSGIGPKTAKLIVVQLAGKLLAATATASTAPPSARDTHAQVVAALVGLGWSERVATETLADMKDSTASTVPALLKQALALLGPTRREPSDV